MTFLGYVAHHGEALVQSGGIVGNLRGVGIFCLTIAVYTQQIDDVVARIAFQISFFVSISLIGIGVEDVVLKIERSVV